jgi:Domain of unknown function (DUF4126)
MFPSDDQLAALVIAVSFAAGLNVYATVGTLGLLGRYDLVTLPGSLDIVSSWWVIGTCAVLFAMEFVADKIPVVDLVWNVLQTFVRVPVAAVLAYAATSRLPPAWQLAAAAAGGAIAFAAHGGKTAARVAVTPSPEPASNFALSLVEDAFAVGLTWFATAHPFIAAGIVLAILATMAIMIRWIWRLLGRARRRRRGAAAV